MTEVVARCKGHHHEKKKGPVTACQNVMNGGDLWPGMCGERRVARG